MFLLFISMNLSYSQLQSKRLLLSESSNIPYNLQVLFHTKITYDDLVTFETKIVQPDTNKLTKLSTIVFNNFNDSVNNHYEHNGKSSTEFMYHIKDEEYPEIKLTATYNKETFKDAKWIKCNGDFKCPFWPGYFKHLLVVSSERNKMLLLWKAVQIENRINTPSSDSLTIDYQGIDQWGKIHFFVPVPPGMQNGDNIVLNIWNIPKLEMYTDNLSMELYK